MKRNLLVVLGLVLGLVLMGNFASAQCGKKAGAACGVKAGAACGVKAGQCVMVCPKCGEEKGGEKCCKDGAAKCEKCGMNKDSMGCCKFPAAAKEKGEAAAYCPGCKAFGCNCKVEEKKADTAEEKKVDEKKD